MFFRDISYSGVYSAMYDRYTDFVDTEFLFVIFNGLLHSSILNQMCAMK